MHDPGVGCNPRQHSAGGDIDRTAAPGSVFDEQNLPSCAPIAFGPERAKNIHHMKQQMICVISRDPVLPNPIDANPKEQAHLSWKIGQLRQKQVPPKNVKRITMSLKQSRASR